MRSVPSRSLARGLSLALLASAMTCRGALAGAYYVEVGGGVSQFRNGDAFFSGATGAPSDLGLNFDAGIYHTFTDGDAPVEVQVGLEHRVSNNSQGPGYYSLMTPYPVVRLQISRIYLGAGATPWLWRRVSGSPGFDSFQFVTGTIGYFAQAGLLYPATPKFSLAIAAGVQVFSTGGTLSPQPLIDFSAEMRFYFGFSSGGGSSGEHGSNEFHGWRYPFGIERHD